MHGHSDLMTLSMIQGRILQAEPYPVRGPRMSHPGSLEWASTSSLPAGYSNMYRRFVRQAHLVNVSPNLDVKVGITGFKIHCVPILRLLAAEYSERPSATPNVRVLRWVYGSCDRLVGSSLDVQKSYPKSVLFYPPERDRSTVRHCDQHFQAKLSAGLEAVVTLEKVVS
ncbi:hypothetical protein JB92DRAFT_2829418 [Gautieria morchelliformis]|nr:hypothetical protein JB92DRAFT_2829418 [Gautieria morchelliformis]